jgi:hypothetical protein
MLVLGARRTTLALGARRTTLVLGARRTMLHATLTVVGMMDA